ncbi:adenylate/guanylate cyclase domain-containing protein [Mycobacterium sp. Y57]|nr:adenylate/guanylate cyclase domain-containing protein [Mycolicibacterium xanthum]
MTFLFTDVEGSTRRWEDDADGMRAALAAHDEVLAEAIDTHGGFLFKHTGDGVCAAFASPKSAVDAAVAAQRALELPVRMGVATGEAEMRGTDYFGAALNRAARVMAAGHGGQILLAESTAALLSGVDLVDLGSRRLRDLPAPIGVFQVRAAGLRTEFPPLRSPDVSPGNLRPATTSFIGRESAVTEVQSAVRAHRVVTLTGAGGVGKTRLATEVAAGVAEEFPDGVWFFDLAAVADPAAVPDAVAAVLGITQQPGKSVTESVATALEGRIRLLVLDNCEHVLDAAADLIEAILAASATARVLATSREGLGIPDEQLWPVPPLEVDSGVDSTAAALFVDRARTVVPHFRLAQSDEATAVVQICARLDGIPLAIELAASRMASMTAGEVRDRLDHRFRLLVGSRRGLHRHHTLRQAVAWSFDLLDEAEKSLLTRCSVFAGAFDLEGACTVAGTDDSGDFAVLDLLDALVRKSLLVADRSDGRTRYSMLETIRDFAEEQLVTRGEATEIRSAHARYFAGREADIMDLWDSPRQREAYTWFTTELPNLRTAFRWAADQGDLDVAATIATYAAFLGVWIDQYEPITWAEELIEPARAVSHPRLAFLYVMAALCCLAGRPETAVGYSDAGQLVVSDDGDNVPFGIQGFLGSSYQFTGQPERSVEWSRAQIAHGLDTHTLTRSALVMALMNAGSAEEAMAAATGLVNAAEATDNPCALSFALMAQGFALSDADPGRARDALHRGLDIAHDSGNRDNETFLTSMLARLEGNFLGRHENGFGDTLAALDNFATAIVNFRDAGNTINLRGALCAMAALLDRLGRYEPGAVIAGFAFDPVTGAWFVEVNTTVAHLRELLGDETYESLARKGEAMSTAAMVTYAYDQIDQARTELVAAAKQM